ncbi:prephenate dehydrogenase [Planctomyces sp. SH-PL14]|nr:prephenate dehydrogenase [Planctomyces sp. SH-PL14]
MSSSDSKPMFSTLVVAGLGLIGGSVAAAAKARGVAERVIGFGRSAARMQGAVDAGLVDEVVDAVVRLPAADLVVVATPVDRIADDVRRIAEVMPDSCLLTDGGSVKEAICRSLREAPPQKGMFVGAHPLAGSERSGWEHADANLFEDKLAVVTPDERTTDDALMTVEGFWKRLGMRVVRMSAADHDRVLALTSHLPHLTAAALAAQLPEDLQKYAARGFRDTTRVAAGDADLWTAIVRLNAVPIADRIDELVSTLANYSTSIRGGDFERVRELLFEGQQSRTRLNEN